MCHWSSDLEDTSSQGKRIKLVANGIYYGETKEGNSRTTYAIVWDNKGRKGLLKAY